jgi:exosortase
MIPIPFRAERLLSHPLQAVATRVSCWILQVLGQPAISEGNVVYINDVQLNVIEACSGLRIFMSIIALTFAYVAVTARPWWTKLVISLSVLPVALLVNASRIALTGLLYRYVSGSAAREFSHDLAGWLMLPVAAVFLALAAWYTDRLIIRAETVSTRDALLPRSISGGSSS